MYSLRIIKWDRNFEADHEVVEAHTNLSLSDAQAKISQHLTGKLEARFVIGKKVEGKDALTDLEFYIEDLANSLAAIVSTAKFDDFLKLLKPLQNIYIYEHLRDNFNPATPKQANLALQAIAIGEKYQKVDANSWPEVKVILYEIVCEILWGQLPVWCQLGGYSIWEEIASSPILLPNHLIGIGHEEVGMRPDLGAYWDSLTIGEIMK